MGRVSKTTTHYVKVCQMRAYIVCLLHYINLLSSAMTSPVPIIVHSASGTSNGKQIQWEKSVSKGKQKSMWSGGGTVNPYNVGHCSPEQKFTFASTFSYILLGFPFLVNQYKLVNWNVQFICLHFIDQTIIVHWEWELRMNWNVE